MRVVCRPKPVRPDLIKKGVGDVAKVSLNDCLACSGCVTSAETVLITQQSIAEIERALADTVRDRSVGLGAL